MRRGRPKHDDLLTPREWEVVALIAEGRTNDQIAECLGISANTVKYHVAQVLSKLGVSSRAEVVSFLSQQQPPRRLPLLAPIWPVWQRAGRARWAPAVSLGVLAVLLLFVASGWRPWPFGSPRPEDSSAPLLADLPPQPDIAPLEPSRFQVSICIDNQTWQRPTLEEQQAYLTQDGRYLPWNDQLAKVFDASFHAGAGPATGRPNPLSKIYLFTGLWTTGDNKQLYAQLDAGCPREPNTVNQDVVDVWILGYEMTVAAVNHGRVVIVVAPRPIGFQALQIQFPGPAAYYAGTIEFQDASGNVIGHVE